MNRALCLGLLVAVAASCGSRSSGGVGTDADVSGNHDGGGNGGADGDVVYDGGSNGNGDGGSNGGADAGNGGADGGGTNGGADAGSGGADGGGTNVDGGLVMDGGSGNVDGGGGSNVDGGLVMDGGSGNVDGGGGSNVDGGSSGAQQLRQYSSRSCWSWGGFGSVRPDAPAHIVAFLEDLDGIADIATSAEVFILGDGGMRYSLGQVGFTSLGDTGCCQRAAKVPITYDNFLAAAQVIDTSTMWGAEAVFRDSAGHTTTATCVNQWRLSSTPIGS